MTVCECLNVPKINNYDNSFSSLLFYNHLKFDLKNPY